MLVSVITLGCKVNEYESQSILNQLKSAGYEIREGLEIADAYIVNTCAVTNTAERKSRQVLAKIFKLNPEAKVGEFIKFLPVLAYDGSSMKEVDAQDILDIALAGTSATLLAKRWESALLVNVDNNTLRRLLDSPEAMKRVRQYPRSRR